MNDKIIMKRGYRRATMQIKNSVLLNFLGYPKIKRGNLHLYFQKKEYKKEYLSKENRKPNYAFDEALLGEYLGFPKRAIQDYIGGVQEYGISYHGLQFATSKENIRNCLLELKNAMPIKCRHKTNIYVYDLMEQDRRWIVDI